MSLFWYGRTTKNARIFFKDARLYKYQTIWNKIDWSQQHLLNLSKCLEVWCSVYWRWLHHDMAQQQDDTQRDRELSVQCYTSIVPPFSIPSHPPITRPDPTNSIRPSDIRPSDHPIQYLVGRTKPYWSGDRALGLSLQKFNCIYMQLEVSLRYSQQRVSIDQYFTISFSCKPINKLVERQVMIPSVGNFCYCSALQAQALFRISRLQIMKIFSI